MQALLFIIHPQQMQEQSVSDTVLIYIHNLPIYLLIESQKITACFSSTCTLFIQNMTASSMSYGRSVAWKKDEYCWVHAITFSTLIISTVYAIMRVSIMAKWALYKQKQQYLISLQFKNITLSIASELSHIYAKIKSVNATSFLSRSQFFEWKTNTRNRLENTIKSMGTWI